MKGFKWTYDHALLEVATNTLVGRIEEEQTFDEPEWRAYGFALEWDDTSLGLFPTAIKAKKEVERWVNDNYL